MSSFTILGSLLGLFAFYPLIKEIRGKKTQQNFASWMLWALLDGISGVTAFIEKGNFLLPSIYSLCCLITAVESIKVTRPKWTNLETSISVLVGICLLVWKTLDTQAAIFASTVAVTLAAIPLLIDTIKSPWDSPTHVWLCYFTANTLVTIGGKEWSVEERLYPCASVVYSGMYVIAAASKYWRTQPAVAPTSAST